MDGGNNTNARGRSSKSSFTDGLLFSDSKPTMTKESNIEEALRSIENRLKNLQATVKDLERDNNLILETLTIIKGQLTKAVSEAILPLEDWVKLRTELKERWPQQKGFSENQLKEIIEDKLHFDTDELEYSAIVKIALEKMKNYLRGTLLKTFDDQVTKAIDEYLQNNSDLQRDEVNEHVKHILRNKQWIKVNPTESDISLAKDLITEEINFRLNNDDGNRRPTKRHRSDKNTNIHPGAVAHSPLLREDKEPDGNESKS